MTELLTTPTSAEASSIGRSARAGTSMAVAAMLCVQLGLAVTVGLFEEIGVTGAAWLRLTLAGGLALLIVRPRRSAFTGASFRGAVVLGVATGGMTLFFMAAIARLPLGTASALEFLGPLGVAVVRSRGANRTWPALALVGVLLLTEPWRGTVDGVGVAAALAAAGCWAAYILLTQRTGDAVSGLSALAVSMPTAALVATVVTLAVEPSAFTSLTREVLLVGLGAAVLLPLVPYALEMLALRRLTTASFGTLMALEPAIALLVGLLLLHQVPGPLAVFGIAAVVTAGIGAERAGARRPPARPPILPPVPPSGLGPAVEVRHPAGRGHD